MSFLLIEFRSPFIYLQLARLVVVAVFFWASIAAAHAADKVALVIGNSNYEHVSVLANPARDAKSVSAALDQQGFVVTTLLDQSFAQLNAELRTFRTAADQAKVALVYYAGHGIEIAGQNYLIPTDAALLDERDAQVQAVNLNALLHQVSGAKNLKVIILDACRNNPFAAKMKRSSTGRNVGRGFAQVETSLPGTLIAYAAAAGETTPDGPAGGNSPFTSAFVETLAGPPVDVRRFFGKVRDNLQKTLPGAEPFLYSSLGGEEVLIQKPKPRVDPAPTTTSANPVSTDKLRNDFDRASKVDNLMAWRVFLQLHGASENSFYVQMAKGRLAEMERQQVAALPQTVQETVVEDEPVKEVEKEGDPTAKLLRAIVESDETAARMAIVRGAEVDAKDRQGTPMLVEAARRGNTSIVRKLLNAGADHDSQDAEVNTAMHAAVLFNHGIPRERLLFALLLYRSKSDLGFQAYGEIENRKGESALSLLMSTRVDDRSDGTHSISVYKSYLAAVISDNRRVMDRKDRSGLSPTEAMVNSANSAALVALDSLGMSINHRGRPLSVIEYARQTKNWKLLAASAFDRDIPWGFKKGATKEAKRQMQSRLKEWGYYQGDLDGAFGPASRKALGNFLDDHLDELEEMASYTSRITLTTKAASAARGGDVIKSITVKPAVNGNCTWKHIEWKATKKGNSTTFFGCVQGDPKWNSNGFGYVDYLSGTTESHFFGPDGWDGAVALR